MTIPDAVVVGLAAICGLWWAWKGLWHGVVGLGCFLAASLMATRYMATGGKTLARLVAMPEALAQMAAYSVLFIVMLIFFKVMLGALLKAFGMGGRSAVTLFGGGILGLVIAWTVSSSAVLMIRMIPMAAPLTPQLQASLFYPYLDWSATRLLDLLTRFSPGFKSQFDALSGALSGPAAGATPSGKPGFGIESLLPTSLQKGLQQVTGGNTQTPNQSYSDIFKALGLDTTDQVTLDEMMKQMK